VRNDDQDDEDEDANDEVYVVAGEWQLWTMCCLVMVMQWWRWAMLVIVLKMTNIILCWDEDDWWGMKGPGEHVNAMEMMRIVWGNMMNDDDAGDEDCEHDEGPTWPRQTFWRLDKKASVVRVSMYL
jgi:hypothetical protein